MIDLHCHILPGLDDGAQTLEESLEMARVAAMDGIHTVVATPHADRWGAEPDQADLESRVAQLQESLDAEGIPVRIVPGLENHLTPELLSGGIVPINHSSYVLVELPFEELPPYAESALFELQLQGYLPILAHPERNTVLRSDHDALRRLVERGILVQLTAASLLGVFGKKTKEASEAYLKQGLAHVLSTDSHSSAGGRRPTLSNALACAARLVGPERAESLVKTVPRQILSNQAVEADAYLSVARPSRWGFWRQ